jgi:hypothetical protein
MAKLFIAIFSKISDILFTQRNPKISEWKAQLPTGSFVKSGLVNHLPTALQVCKYIPTYFCSIDLYTIENI